MSNRFVLVLAIAVLALFLSQPVAAQEGGGDITVGYTAVTNDMLAVNSGNLPGGWYSSGTINLADGWSIAFTGSGAFGWGIEPSASLEGVVRPTGLGGISEFQGLSFHRPETEWCSFVLTQCNVLIQSVTAGAGPRYTFGTGGRVQPFVHFQAGFTRILRKIENFTQTATNFAITPGGGVDIGLDDNDRFGIRVQIDYSHAFVPNPADSKSTFVVLDGKDFNELRVGFGLIMKIGSWR
jgi:hypothetical protein